MLEDLLLELAPQPRDPFPEFDTEMYSFPPEEPQKGWYLVEGVALIRKLQEKAWACGYHLALGGGVLNKGYSDKDLDIECIPGDKIPSGKQDISAFLSYLSEKHGITSSGEPHSRYQGMTVYKLSTKEGQWIDLVVLKLEGR
jgi:hypothetical protein